MVRKKLEKEQFICIDCEATGLSLEDDDIIEIAAVTFTLEKNLIEEANLVDPQRDIPHESIEIHHITNEMVSSKPKIQEVLSKYLDLIADKTIIGHGVGFDIQMITIAAKKHQINCNIENNEVIDTLRLARLYGESPINSLKELGKHFNIPTEGAHRALNDVFMNIEVFKRLIYKFRTIDEIFEVLSKPIKLKKMPLGKHKGRPLKEIPLDYLRWAAKKDFDQDLLYSIRSEISRRSQANDFSQASNPFSGL